MQDAFVVGLDPARYAWVKAHREKLLPHWQAYHEGVARQPKRYPIPNDPASYMCRHSSLYLAMLLEREGECWTIVGGEILSGLDGANHSHWWLERNGIRLDITASQFGYEEILVTNVSDPRYKRLDCHAGSGWWRGLKRTVAKWLPTTE